MSAWNGRLSARIPLSAVRTRKVLTNVNVKMDCTGLTARAKVRKASGLLVDIERFTSCMYVNLLYRTKLF